MLRLARVCKLLRLGRELVARPVAKDERLLINDKYSADCYEQHALNGGASGHNQTATANRPLCHSAALPTPLITAHRSLHFDWPKRNKLVRSHCGHSCLHHCIQLQWALDRVLTSTWPIDGQFSQFYCHCRKPHLWRRARTCILLGTQSTQLGSNTAIQTRPLHSSSECLG